MENPRPSYIYDDAYYGDTNERLRLPAIEWFEARKSERRKEFYRRHPEQWYANRSLMTNVPMDEELLQFKLGQLFDDEEASSTASIQEWLLRLLCVASPEDAVPLTALKNKLGSLPAKPVREMFKQSKSQQNAPQPGTECTERQVWWFEKRLSLIGWYN